MDTMSIRDKQFFTTGQIAKLVGVAMRTVTKWIDSGALEGYRLPMSTDRRVRRAELVRFLRMHDALRPYAAELGVSIVLAVGLDDTTRTQLAELLANRSVELVAASTWFHAGELSAKLTPSSVVVDCSMGRGEVATMAASIHSEGSAYQGTQLIVLLNEDGTGDASDYPASVKTFRKPVDAAQLAYYLLNGKPYPIASLKKVQS